MFLDDRAQEGPGPSLVSAKPLFAKVSLVGLPAVPGRAAAAIPADEVGAGGPGCMLVWVHGGIWVHVHVYMANMAKCGQLSAV